MLDDAILKEAIGAAMEFRLATVPDGGEEHIFSERFERKMQKLIHRSEHPIRYQALRVAAAVIVTVATLFGAVFAASPQVRAEVAEWFRKVFTVTYDTDSDAPAQTDLSGYRLRAIPKGYEEYSVLEMTHTKHYSYVREDGNILKFSYKFPVGSGGVSITGDYVCRTGEVNGIPATLYISPDGSEANVIVWEDPETGVILWLKAWEDAEILTELAQTVERIGK